MLSDCGNTLVLKCVHGYDRVHGKQDHLGSRNLKGSAGYCLQTVAISSAHLACVYVVCVSVCVCGVHVCGVHVCVYMYVGSCTCCMHTSYA